MKLVNREDFLKLPEGVVYYDAELTDKGEVVIGGFGDLHIKGESCTYDYIENNLNGATPVEWKTDVDICESWEAMIGGKDIDFTFDVCGRDGMFDENAKYLVLNKKEVKSLIDELTEAHKSYPL